MGITMFLLITAFENDREGEQSEQAYTPVFEMFSNLLLMTLGPVTLANSNDNGGEVDCPANIRKEVSRMDDG